MRVTVATPDLRDLQQDLRALRNRAPKVMARAANDAGVTARKTMAQEITKIYTVKSNDIKKALDLKRATASKPEALVKTNAQGQYKIPLYAHKLSPKKVWNPAMSVKPKPKTYKVQIRKTGGAKIVPHSFVAKMASGHQGLFVRQENAIHRKNPKAGDSVRQKKTQLGIKEVYSQAIAQMVGRQSVMEVVTRETQNTLKRRLEHEIARTLGGH